MHDPETPAPLPDDFVGDHPALDAPGGCLHDDSPGPLCQRAIDELAAYLAARLRDPK